MKLKIVILALGALAIICAGGLGAIFAVRAGNATELAQNDLIFIHHSVGKNWLDNSLHQALIQKPYIDQVNDTFYGTYVPHTAGRPDSLGPRAGDLTDANHWLFWFNDYLDGVKNRANEDIFAENPETLFIFVTNPPSRYGPEDAITGDVARRNRALYDWLPGYNQAHPGLNNVAIFDLHDIWAYPNDHPEHPNRLREEFGGKSGDSHPNQAANSYATELFAANPENFIDQAWNLFQAGR